MLRGLKNLPALVALQQTVKDASDARISFSKTIAVCFTSLHLL